MLSVYYDPSIRSVVRMTIAHSGDASAQGNDECNQRPEVLCDLVDAALLTRETLLVVGS